MLVSKHDLQKLLSATVKVVENRATIPILSTVRLIAGDGKLSVTATDLDVEISGVIDAETPEALAVCVDAKLLAAVVGKAGGADITIEPVDGGVVVKSGRNRSTLNTLPVEDFPTMAAGEFAAEFTADMSTVLGRHAFAMSDEQTRYYLIGVFLEPTAATATNGHKLSTSAHALPEFEPIIVPAKTVALAPKGEVTVRLSPTRVQFATADFIMTSKVVDGTFPDWRRIMPKADTAPVTVDNTALREAVERVAIVDMDKEPAVKMEIAADEILLGAHGSGESTDVVPCAYEGESVTVGFNARYLGEILASLPAGNVTIVPADGMSPVLFTSAVDESRRVVCMPRRV